MNRFTESTIEATARGRDPKGFWGKPLFWWEEETCHAWREIIKETFRVNN
jgi:hypothetical protein